jgi:hypothetical protein
VVGTRTDFQVQIAGDVTGFDVTPINDLTNALKTVPASRRGDFP